MQKEEATAKFYFDEAIDVGNRSYLVSKLEREKGVASAWFEPGEPQLLIVNYDADWFGRTTLIDAMREFGFSAKSVDTPE